MKKKLTMLAFLAYFPAWAAGGEQDAPTAGPQSAHASADLTILGLKEESPRIPEHQPGTALYGAYSMFGSLNDTGPSQGALILKAGTSLGPHNFEMSGDLSTNWRGTSDQKLMYARYQREFFDQRLRLSVGRLSGAGPGAYAARLPIDGIQIQRFSSDEQGRPRYANVRTIKGFNPVAGILLYSVGNEVLREFPLPAGPFELHAGLFDGLPRGGTLEVRQFNGKTLPLDNSQLNGYAAHSQLEAGELEWSASVGQARSALAPGRRLELSSQYGITNDLTVGLSVSDSDSATTYQGQLHYRLPKDWGAAGFSMTTYDPKAESFKPTEYRAYYRGRTDSTHYSLDVSRNQNGAIPLDRDAGVVNSLSQPVQNISIGLGTRLFNRLSTNLQLGRQDYTDRYNFFSGLSLSFSLGSYGSMSLYLQRTLASGQPSASTAAVTWLIPLASGRSFFTTVRSSSDQNLQYALGYSSTDSVTFHSDRQLQLTVGTDGASAVGSTIGNSFAASGGVTRGVSGNTSAYAAVSGAAVYMPQAGLILARAIANPLVVVKSTPALGEGALYMGSSTMPLVQLNSRQAAVVPSSLPTYQRNHLRLEDNGERLGIEMPDTLTDKAFHPNRAYLLKVSPKTLRPARLYLVNSSGHAVGKGGVAALADGLLPVEGDSSVYLQNLDDVEAGSFTVSFFEGFRKTLTCTLSDADLKPSPTPEFTTRNLKGVLCTEQ